MQVGSTLSGDPGQWKSTKDISYTYQWLRCNEKGGECTEISGATKTTYTVVQADVGHTIRFQVTAKNKDGKTTANSNPTAIVQQGGGGGGGGGGSVVDVKDVGPAGERLVVDKVTFNPNPVTSRNVPIHVNITVKDTKGKLVKGALVFLRSTPVVASIPTDAPTGSDGTVSYTIQPEADFPIKNSYSVQFFVKAYRSGDPTLAASPAPGSSRSRRTSRSALAGPGRATGRAPAHLHHALGPALPAALLRKPAIGLARCRGSHPPASPAEDLSRAAPALRSRSHSLVRVSVLSRADLTT